MTDDTYYQDLGLRCGLEIHQQLLTEKKLFCRCKAVLHNDMPSSTILRHMRPTLSELGEYDGTALMEFKTKKNVTYQLYDDTVCTYEMDDTPPFSINQQALDISLEIALLLNCSIVNEIHISRKQYLDGSIPTGFQRTGIIGIEGYVQYKNRKIKIIQLGLEEDACREVTDKGHTIVFKTDRLSIPLVEVVTYPDIKTPCEAAEVAHLIGRVLRSTGKVRRGLGSIRQDVNVSINGGTRVELKGVPKIKYIKNAVAHEAGRQKALLDIRDELRLRGISEKTFHSEHADVTSAFTRTKHPFFKEVIKKKDSIYVIILAGFAGILDIATQPGKTFADELSGRVRVIACLDEMPNLMYSTHFKEFKIHPEEIAKLKKQCNVKLTDEIVLVWGDETDVKTAVEEINIRSVEATIGVPSETRQVFSDGTNDFERILPGPDRMYPDTDTPPTPILENKLEQIKSNLPEQIWDSEKKLKTLGIPDHLITSLSISTRLKLFYKIIETFDVKPVLVAVTFIETIKYLQRKGKQVERISDDALFELFELISQQKTSKEAIPLIIDYVADNPDKTVKDAIRELHITPISIKKVKEIIDKVSMYYCQENIIPSLNRAMGDVMRQVRYKMDGKQVMHMLKAHIIVSNN
ncbi:MAG: Glu-tRNA(Gln) amidotransferase subunit GatE [Candidatus Thermoplasmatota archaeon]|nr:Glu-tRNA(Gln) amidotransferase subunit GatE [Candidatus Thermoplasmatota archaeon]